MGENQTLFPSPGNSQLVNYFNIPIDIIFLENVVRGNNWNALDVFCGPTKI